MHIDVISLFAGVFGSEITEDDVYDLIYGYDIIDEYGNVIYSRNGKAVATPIGDGIFLESWMFAGEEQTNVLTVTDDGVSSINIDSNYLLVEGTELGDVIVITEDYKYGVMNAAGDFIVMDEFDAVFVSGEYYIAHETDAETYEVVKSLVYDRNGDCVWKYDDPVTYYNGKVAAVETVDSLELEGETFEYNIMKLIDLSTGDIIVDAENIYCEGEYIFAEYSSSRPCGTSVYSTDGEYIGGRDAFAVCVDEGNSTVIFEDYDKEKTYRVNADMEIVEELSYNNSYLKSYDNVSVVTDFGTADDGDYYEDDCIDYLTYKGVKISGDHYSLWDSFVTDGCEVYVFSDYDAETLEITYVAYIIAGDKSPFNDVQENHWAVSYIRDCYEKGIMNGTGGGKFSPATEVSRAQVVTTLWRLAGEPEPEGENKFVDVQNVLWYSAAVTWAAENGITTGVGGAYFAPDRTVTRGEVAAILYRYAEYAGDDMTAKADLSTFADAGELSDWNRDAFAWCAAEGIITGKTAGENAPVRLAPSDALTRAEIAAVLCRYGA